MGELIKIFSVVAAIFAALYGGMWVFVYIREEGLPLPSWRTLWFRTRYKTVLRSKNHQLFYCSPDYRLVQELKDELELELAPDYVTKEYPASLWGPYLTEDGYKDMTKVPVKIVKRMKIRQIR